MFPNIREVFLAHFKYLRLIYGGANVFKCFVEELSPKMKKYYPMYCKVTGTTTAAVLKKYNEDPKFKQYLEGLYERYNSHIIGDYMGPLFQRIMRYPLIFKEVVKLASEDDLRSDMYAGCKEALECANATTNYVDDLVSK